MRLKTGRTVQLTARQMRCKLSVQMCCCPDRGALPDSPPRSHRPTSASTRWLQRTTLCDVTYRSLTALVLTIALATSRLLRSRPTALVTALITGNRTERTYVLVFTYSLNTLIRATLLSYSTSPSSWRSSEWLASWSQRRAVMCRIRKSKQPRCNT